MFCDSPKFLSSRAKIRLVREADLTNEALAATLFVNLRSPIAPQRQTV